MIGINKLYLHVITTDYTMNKLFAKIRAITCLSVLASFTFTSCVNEEYDISKGIDLDMQLLQNTSFPLGNISTISIESLLMGDDSMSSVFDVDSEGNLSLKLFNDVISEVVEMPTISFSGEGGISAKTSNVNFMLDLGYTNLPGSVLAENLIALTGSDKLYYNGNSVTQNPDEASLHTSLGVEVDKELPEEILSLRAIDMDAALEFRFTASEGAVVHIEKGLTIEFPDYMCLTTRSDIHNYQVVDNYKVVFTEDTEVSYKNPLVLDFRLIRLQGLTDMLRTAPNATGKLVRYVTDKDKIQVDGNMYIKASDYGYGYIPSRPKIAMDVMLSDLEMKSAEIIIDLNLDVDDMELEIGDLPEMFSGKNTVLDLYNPTLKFKINNETPFELNLNAEITAYGSRNTTDIHVGNHCINGNDETDEILVPAADEIEYYFSRQGKHDSFDGEDIKLEEIGEIVTDLPEKIKIHEISVDATEKYIKIYSGREYDVDIEYEFFCPMSFGRDMNVSFEYDIALGLSGDVAGLECINIAMDMVNTIPLNFEIKGVALDEDGKELKDANVDLDLKLLAGTIDNPTTSHVEIVLETNNSEINIGKLRLVLSATSSKNLQGVLLNTAQGLAINGLSVTLPKGIVMDYTDSEFENFE